MSKDSTRRPQTPPEQIRGILAPQEGFSFVTDPASPRLADLAETVLQEFLDRGMIEPKHIKALDRSKFKTQMCYWLHAHLQYAYDVTALEEARESEVKNGKAPR